ncbi:hypothetical protein V1281_004745 [Nitrobacteraceae bacterium AZCC 2161]
MPLVFSSSLFGLPPRACVALSTFFALLVVGPSLLRCYDILLLEALRAPRQQNHETVAILTEVDPIAWSEIDPEFLDTCPDSLHVGEVAEFYASQRNRNLGGGLGIEMLKPASSSDLAILTEARSRQKAAGRYACVPSLNFQSSLAVYWG